MPLTGYTAASIASCRGLVEHGRAQSAGALIAATMFISITSIQLYQEALPRLVHPEGAIHENLSLAAGVVVFSMVVALAPLIGLLRQRSRGAAAAVTGCDYCIVHLDAAPPEASQRKKASGE